MEKKNSFCEHVQFFAKMHAPTISIISKNMKGCTDAEVNRTPVTVPLTGQLFGVIFLRGHISLKNRSYRPLLIERACPFKNMCLPS
jgi:hypothetical protein